MPYADPAKRKARDRARYAANRERRCAQVTAHYAENGDRIRAERAAKRTDETRSAAAIRQRNRYRAIRAEVIDAYGGRCACCGESEATFLELDHVDSDGAEHRRMIGRGAHATYKWAKDQGFPASFQLLCANCNQGRHRNGGVCPHVG